MGWFKSWIFGDNKSTQNKAQTNLNANQKTEAEKQAEYLRETLVFAKSQHRTLTQKHRELEVWRHHYGSLQANELKGLSGTEFEDYLLKLFEHHGYQVETTPCTGDYGADLILQKNNQRIAVQAKCYSGSVGVSAVQEALSGMAYYRCHHAWVVTTGTYTTNAIELAKQSNVRLLDGSELGILIGRIKDKSFKTL